ncbi:MAG TPA: nitrite/sulfite reductase [Kofleriaceae bacterium]|jgi:sulfite reductase (ferredoxin)|nr:nitrite/sulfite reductase [Kofleriaceae bacterium]
MSLWKERLADRMPAALADEIDAFETQMELRRRGKVDEKVFAETRLRRGAYGQRYDNGKRHDGVDTRELTFPCGDLKKGPDTVWDAPGMVRIKIPLGRLSAEQMDTLAALAEEYSDHILHVTTRQDIQLHFIHIEDTPDLMRRLAAVGITTREACGNSVRNVTGCPYAGVCSTQSFDVSPYGEALAWFLLGHRDVQDFGRKFKIAFSGCRDEACALTNIHDLGAIATVRDGRRGFELYVGGGLGAIPFEAKLLDDFVTEEELLPVTQAVCRVYARLGEKKNRNRARIKFLVAQVGIDELRRLVKEERATLQPDPRWTAYLADLHATDEKPLKPAAPLAAGIFARAFTDWRRTNVRPQAQPGYVVATVRLPLGDLTSAQMRALADLARRYTGDTVRLTVEQNLVFRWLPEADLPAFHKELAVHHLAGANAGTIADITACPGTDTCKLGISASRGLARVLEQRLAADIDALDERVAGLRIKTSGCFNSCGQHHIADIGFLGVSRNVGGRRVAHFQLVVGGKWAGNGAAYGMAIGAFPAKRVPQVVRTLTDYYVAERANGESFHAFVERVGKAAVRTHLDPLKEVPAYADDPSFYVDWGDAREYTIGDMGVGECAGEIVSLTEFGLADAERVLYEAQAALEVGDPARAGRLGYDAMVAAAKALIKVQYIDIADDPARVVDEFRTRLVDTQLFHDPYAGAKFAHFFLHAGAGDALDDEKAHRRVEEAALFIEAAHACYDRMQEAPAAAPSKLRILS